MAGMTSPRFRSDLYHGTAGYYDSYRLAYPAALIDDLTARVRADGTGRLLDLACGTGQVSFALRGRFTEIWAVDQEPDMIRLVSQKAQLADGPDPSGPARMVFVTCAAEQLSAPEQAFDLVTMGNAFHRLRREEVAVSVMRWLRPGCFLALLWGGSPLDGNAPWQHVLRATLQRWQGRRGAAERIPAGYDADRRTRPDVGILAAAGFTIAGRHEFAFRRELLACEPDGRFRQDATFAYDLACRPA
jgi:SAM-dependent methyltransferase